MPAAGQAAAPADPQAQRAQVMMQRIINMQWSIPTYAPISPECQDLLQHLIVADPARRLTMEQVGLQGLRGLLWRAACL